MRASSVARAVEASCGRCDVKPTDAVVLGRGERERERTHRLEPLKKLSSHGSLQFLRLRGSQDVGAAAKQIRVGGRGPARFLTGERMSAQKLRATNGAARAGDNLDLRAAGVGHQGAGLEPLVQRADGSNDAPDGLGKINQVGWRNRALKRQPFVDGAHGERIANGTGRADAQNASAKTGLAERQSERRADQSHTDDGDRTHGYISRPTARAMMRNCCISSSNSFGRSDCAPSLSA